MGKNDPIEMEKQRLAEEWLTAPTDEKRQELINQYLMLDDHTFERTKVKWDNMKVMVGNLVTVGLCLLTLNFEKFDTIRSKASAFWLRRRN